MRDYEKISRAISFIQQHTHSQPSLDEVAQQVHLSPHHFQRLFSRWAGTSPKRLLQVLTLEPAKSRLAQCNGSTLDVSNVLGLSSSSRLYDLFVQIEAVTPSEFRRRGAGLTIYWGVHPTAYGDILIATTDRGVYRAEFTEPDETSARVSRLQQDWPLSSIVEDTERAKTLVDALSPTNSEPVKEERQKQISLSLRVRGTNFQIAVWRALLEIQPGQASTYGEIAQKIGHPAAVRAVGSAIGANPVALAIPCHRVIRSDGKLGGYRWGKPRKQAMLAREIAQTVSVERN